MFLSPVVNVVVQPNVQLGLNLNVLSAGGNQSIGQTARNTADLLNRGTIGGS